jgi:hypothetical protein
VPSHCPLHLVIPDFDTSATSAAHRSSSTWPVEFNANRAGFGIKAADPFDVGTGIYYRKYLDLQVEDTNPIRFERTQRNLDLRSRSFGVGGCTSYDTFIIGDVEKFSWVALALADGGQIR